MLVSVPGQFLQKPAEGMVMVIRVNVAITDPLARNATMTSRQLNLGTIDVKRCLAGGRGVSRALVADGAAGGASKPR